MGRNVKSRVPRVSAPIVAALVVLGALAIVTLATSGNALAKEVASCSVTVHKENKANDAIQTEINTYPGGTICIGAGTFPEQLTISASGTVLKGAGAGKTIIEPAAFANNTFDYDTAAAPGDSVGLVPYAAIILIENSTANMATTGVTVEDLQVNGDAIPTAPYNSCDRGFIGVDFQNASGTLTHATVSNIAESSTYFGCQSGTGLGVYAYNGYYFTGTVPDPAISVTISDTTVTGYQKNGITCDDLGESCTLASDSVAGVGPTPLTGQNGIQVGFGAYATITGSTSSGNSYTGSGYPGGTTNDWYNATGYSASGVLLYDPATGTTVSGNKVELNQMGIVYADDGTLDAGAESVTISHNTVEESNGYGIVANGAPGGGDSVTISSNTVNDEETLNPSIWGAPGILVDTGTFTLSKNHILGSQAVEGASNGANQTVCAPSGFVYTCSSTENITTAAIEGVSGSSTNPTTLILSGGSYTLDSYRLVTLGVDGGTVNVEE